MPPSTIMINYHEMARLVVYFRHHQVRVKALQERLEDQIDILRRGAWQSNRATKFYSDCTPVLEGVARLSHALGSAGETIEQVASLFRQAEQEGGASIPMIPGVTATVYNNTTDAPPVRIASQRR